MAEGLPARRGPLRRALGTVAIARAWPRQRSLPYVPEEHWAALRDRRVREAVRFAARRVPHYRARLRDLGLDPREIRGAGDLPALPIISRADLLAEGSAAFRPAGARDGDGLVIRTSGSTGEPLDVLHDTRSALANIAYSERERAVDTGILGRASGYRILAFEYRSSTLPAVRAFYDAAAYRPRRPGFAFVPTDEPLDHALAALDRVRPDVVVGPGAWLEVVFAAVEAAPRRVHRPAAVVYGGSAMSPEWRRRIEEEHGVPVLSRYNAGESLKIGYFCENRDGFHLHEDLCHVEVVDDGGAPVAEDVRGSVVVSNLVNRGTVLLRYRLGDHARLTSVPCACGRTSRRLLDLEGKRNVILRLPDGSAMHARALWGVIKQAEGVRRFQLVQHEPDRIEARLQTDGRATYERVLPLVRPGLERLLPGCRVEVTWHERLTAPPGTRFEPIVPYGGGE